MNNPAFYDRVEAYTERASRLFPSRTTFSKKELALIADKSPQTIYNNRERYNFRSPKISIKEFVRMEIN